MESFFALLEKNVLTRRRWGTREALRLAVTTWIERTCPRRQRVLGRLAPTEARLFERPFGVDTGMLV